MEKSRERVLTYEELRELWATLDCLATEVEDKTDELAQKLRSAKARVTPATAQAFQVQLLTAQRPGETRRCGGPMLISRAAGGLFPLPLRKTNWRTVCR